jgi:hypothetical protein
MYEFQILIYKFLQKFNYIFFKLLNFNRLILIFLDCFLFSFVYAGLKSEIYYKKKLNKKQSKNIRISLLKFNNLKKKN